MNNFSNLLVAKFGNNAPSQAIPVNPVVQASTQSYGQRLRSSIAPGQPNIVARPPMSQKWGNR